MVTIQLLQLVKQFLKCALTAAATVASMLHEIYATIMRRVRPVVADTYTICKRRCGRFVFLHAHRDLL